MIICDRLALRESTPADITGHDSIVYTCGRTIIWKRPCICPMVSGRSSRSVPASISTLGPLKPRKASLSPSYHPRLRQMQSSETTLAQGIVVQSLRHCPSQSFHKACEQGVCKAVYELWDCSLSRQSTHQKGWLFSRGVRQTHLSRSTAVSRRSWEGSDTAAAAAFLEVPALAPLTLIHTQECKALERVQDLSSIDEPM